MKIFIKIMTVIGAIAAIFFFIYAFKNHLFQDPHALQAFIKKFGPYGVVVFILMQVIQPIIPIIPGGLSDVAGILMFGNVLGLFYVCLGLVIGESISFLLMRRYGKRFAATILSPKNMDKLNELIKRGDKHMLKILAIVFIMPFGPDDIACLAAGLSNVSFKKYFATIALLKPISVGVHCFIMIEIFKVL